MRVLLGISVVAILVVGAWASIDRYETAWHRFDRPDQLDGNQDQSSRGAIRRILIRAERRQSRHHLGKAH